MKFVKTHKKYPTCILQGKVVGLKGKVNFVGIEKIEMYLLLDQQLAFSCSLQFHPRFLFK